MEDNKKSSQVVGATSEDKRKIKGITIELDKNDELIIKISSINEPPVAIINGKEIKGISKLNYQYETKKQHDRGINVFFIEYCDAESFVINQIGKERM